MRSRQTVIAGAIIATLGFTTAGAFAQSVTPATPDTPQRGNPSSMPQGSRAGDAPGMNSATPGQRPTAQQVNPSPMPPGSRANQAPGMGATNTEVDRAVQSQAAGALPGSSSPADPSAPRPGVTAQGTAVPGGTAPGMTPGAAPAMRAQSDPPGSTPARPADPMTPGTGAATGATTPGPATQGGGASTNPPATTTQHTAPRTAAAPVAGANSFTEGQARARIGDAGFNDVQELRLDEQGIWRGRAMRNGQQTSVALDYQGNVVATQ
ncbi:hypothetical protein [Falsiroseomonas stagni]|uniref:Peptidase propeptide and YPEB domain-containing protein n=1 Tax=Falsiroseomonas stagni DSM 19981 TaxID=1123062 RepID=A0A1I4BYZ0_9PROT|nr:hypothetical protein [Falsiroseomonas stagni]SFK74002.1 hypothetical protein SAMN02745775_106270 [Falsiroseomonas stagni DSM 19981]